MQLLERLIFKELVLPFLGIVLFLSALLMASVYLFTLADFFVSGVSISQVALLFLLYLPGIVAWTFPMASLLSVLLGFGRLSAASEIIAVFASGVHLFRLALPAFLLGLAVALVGLFLGQVVVPFTAIKAQQVRNGILQQQGKTSETVQFLVKSEGKLEYSVTAQGANPQKNALFRVTVTRHNLESGEPQAVLYAPRAFYASNKWHFENAKVTEFRFGGALRFNVQSGSAIPPDFTVGRTPSELAMDAVPPENLSSAQINQRRLREMRQGGNTARLEVEYYNKYAVPIASAVFALLAVPLGIRDPRRSTAAIGWVSAIGIIILYWVFTRLMFILGAGGKVAPWVASFAPTTLVLLVALALLWKRSR